VNAAAQYYVATLLVYTFAYAIAAIGLNLQFGVTGIFNFAYIVFQAAGAYFTAVLTLGPSGSNGAFQHYIIGLRLPFPLPLLISAGVSAGLGVLVGLLTLRRLRTDYLAIVMLVVSLIATEIATDQTGLFNGAQGLALVPQPFASMVSSTVTYDWLYAAMAGVIAGLVWWAVRLLVESPLGRVLRAVRENEAAAAALGKDVLLLRLLVFALGGAIAGVSGSVLVQFLGVWSPATWYYPETFVIFTALVVGGTGSNLGPLVGTVLVPVVLGEGSRYLPQIGSAELMPSLQWIAIGIMLLFFLWFWPQGVVPERRRRFPERLLMTRGERAGSAPQRVSSR
jgi:branched-chain amino acid transport system permease protein